MTGQLTGPSGADVWRATASPANSILRNCMRRGIKEGARLPIENQTRKSLELDLC